MSLKVGFTGKFGNNLFQYVAGRLFAEENNLQLSHPPLPWPDTLFGIQSLRSGRVGDINAPPVYLDDSIDLFGRPHGLASYRMSGFFQQGHWYHDRRERILEFMSPRETPEVNEEDIVAHVRTTDYLKWGIAPHPSWYRAILEKEAFRRLHLVVEETADQSEAAARYLEHFKRWDPVIHHGTIWEDWNALRGFRRMIIPNSTFSWWAAFFSNADVIYLPERWLKGCPTANLAHGFPNGITVDGPFIDEETW